MNIVGLIILIIVVVLVSILVWIGINFQRYKAKLSAVVLKESGGTERVDITDKEGSFTTDNLDKSYQINKSCSYLDHWIYPRKTVYYKENMTNPIGSESDDSGNNNIGPRRLNGILKTKFGGLFKTQSQGISIPISKRWAFVIAIVIIAFILIFFFWGDIMSLVGAGGGGPEVRPPTDNWAGR